MKKILKTLMSQHTPSGMETKGKTVLKDILTPYVDDCYEDVQGNLICVKQGSSHKKKLVLIAHIDEVSMMVKYVEETGFLRVVKQGAINDSLLIGLNVIVHHDGHEVRGVIGAFPPHFKINNDDLDVTDLWVDIGATCKSEALSFVSVGDMVTYESKYFEFPNSIVCGVGCDDKAGITVLVCLMKALRATVLDYDLIFVASVQEEVGARGAITAAYGLEPDVCIVVDVTHATDYPLINRSKFGDIRLGHGPSLPLGTDFSFMIQNELISIAKEHNYLYQIEAMPKDSCTDIHPVQVSRNGCLTGMIGVPCRYMHSPVELVSMIDLNTAVKLLVSFCKVLNSSVIKDAE